MKIGEPVTLVVGSDGQIGSGLMALLQRAGERVVGTTRRLYAVGESRLYLDLTDDTKKWDFPWPVNVAVMCAGITSGEVCMREPAATALVNVQGACALAEKLVAHGAFVIFLSSNQVFDGSMPYRNPDDPASPVNEYGRQKAEAERFIRRGGHQIAIVRFGKILGPETPVLSTWREALLQGRSVHSFSDMYVSPVPLNCALSILRLVADRRQCGILQVSGECEISYTEVAYLGAKLLGADPRLVKPGDYQSRYPLEPKPAGHTTLNIDRLESTLGIRPPDVLWTIQAAFTNPRKLGI